MGRKIVNKLSNSVGLLLYLVGMVAILALLITPQFLLILPVWYLVSLIAYSFASENRRKVLLLMVLYPYLELLVKLLVLGDVVQYSWAVLNRVEHGIATMFISYMVWVIFSAKSMVERSRLDVALISVGIVNLMGVLNELVEYLIRVDLVRNLFGIALLSVDTEGRELLYYADTIHDLIVNLLVSILVVVLLYLVGKLNDVKVRRLQSPL